MFVFLVIPFESFVSLVSIPSEVTIVLPSQRHRYKYSRQLPLNQKGDVRV